MKVIDLDWSPVNDFKLKHSHSRFTISMCVKEPSVSFMTSLMAFLLSSENRVLFCSAIGNHFVLRKTNV